MPPLLPSDLPKLKREPIIYPKLPFVRRDKAALGLFLLGMSGFIFTGVLVFNSWMSLVLLLMGLFLAMISFFVHDSTSAQDWSFSLLVGQHAEQMVQQKHGKRVLKSLLRSVWLSLGAVGLLGLWALWQPTTSLQEAIQWGLKNNGIQVIDLQTPPADWPVGEVRLENIHIMTSSLINLVSHQTMEEPITSKNNPKVNWRFLRERWTARLLLPGATPLLMRFDCLIRDCQPPWLTNTIPTELSGIIVPRSLRFYKGKPSETDVEESHLWIGLGREVFIIPLVLTALLVMVPLVSVGGVAFYWRRFAFPIHPGQAAAAALPDSPMPSQAKVAKKQTTQTTQTKKPKKPKKPKRKKRKKT